METPNNLLYCYNKGCGQRFDPETNSPDSCVHHPGVPVFHDAYKSWSCCEKKTTDFTDFLGIIGCTVASHNGVKPPAEEKPKKDDTLHTVICKNNKTTLPKQERPDKNSPTVDLSFTVTHSLTMQLQQIEKEARKGDTLSEVDSAIPIGTSCKNGGCRKSFQCEDDSSEECQYHPGQPVFHEGLKFWSCCVRRTSDFNSFLEQSGCTVGLHLWMKPKSSDHLLCRYDWYQTGSHVFLSVYAKLPIPTMSRVVASPVFLNVLLTFGEEKSTFKLDLELFGVVEVDKSHVTYSPNKIEIKLKKGEPANWVELIFPLEKV